MIQKIAYLTCRKKKKCVEKLYFAMPTKVETEIKDCPQMSVLLETVLFPQ